MSDIVFSAPGKVILHGEHACVFGRCAVAATLDLRTELQVKLNDQNQVRAFLPDVDVEVTWDISEIQGAVSLPLGDPLNPASPDPLTSQKLSNLANVDPSTTDTKKLALVAFLYLYCNISYKDGRLPPVDIIVRSHLPTGAGLGSSASYSVCLATSLLLLSKLIPEPEKNIIHENKSYKGWNNEKVLKLINDWSYQGEAIIHGKCSGIDIAVSTYGTAIKFENKQIELLHSAPSLRILLVNTKVPRSTKTLVENVHNKYEKYPEIIRPILDSIGAVSLKCISILQESSQPTNEHYKTLSELITINQNQLNILGVSHPSLENIFRITNKYGFPCKLTGAGGGGCAFALISPQVSQEVVNEVKEELMKLGYDSWETTIGASGILKHV